MAQERVHESRDGSAVQHTIRIAVAGVALEAVDEFTLCAAVRY
jgi:hypothetical protein